MSLFPHDDIVAKFIINEQQTIVHFHVSYCSIFTFVSAFVSFNRLNKQALLTIQTFLWIYSLMSMRFNSSVAKRRHRKHVIRPNTAKFYADNMLGFSVYILLLIALYIKFLAYILLASLMQNMPLWEWLVFRDGQNPIKSAILKLKSKSTGNNYFKIKKLSRSKIVIFK